MSKAASAKQSDRRGGVERHPSGATVLNGVRDPKDVGRVAFLCRDCCPAYEQFDGWLAGQGVAWEQLTLDDLKRGFKALGACCDGPHFVRPHNVLARSSKSPWKGRCKPCRRPDAGGLFRLDPDKRGWGWVTDPDTGEERYRRVPTGKELETFTGRDPASAGKHRKKWKGVKEHKSGAILLGGERDPEDPEYRAAFICANYLTDAPLDERLRAAAERRADPLHPRCAVKAFGWLSQFRDESWCGLERSCVLDRGGPKKYTEPVTLDDGPGGTKGTQLRFDVEDGHGNVLIIFQCGCERFRSRLTARRYLTAGEAPPQCRECFSSRDARVALLHAPPQNGDAQKNGGDVLSAVQLSAEGRKLLGVVGEIVLAWKAVYNPALSRDENLAAVKQRRVAVRLGYENSVEGEKKLAAMLRRLRMNEIFTGGSSWWKPLVMDVVDEHERGAAPEAIVLRLLPPPRPR